MVAAPDAGSAPDVIPERFVLYDTWAQAAAVVDFPVREPAWLPPGYLRTGLQASAVDEPDLPAQPFHSVTAIYEPPSAVDLPLHERVLGDGVIVFEQSAARSTERDLRRDVDAAAGRGVPTGTVDLGEATGYRVGATSELGPDTGESRLNRSDTVLRWTVGGVEHYLLGTSVDPDVMARLARSLKPVG